MNLQRFLEVASRQLASSRQADEISGSINIKKEPEDDERIRKIKHKNPKKRMQDAQESVCDRCGIKHQPGYCKALGQICLGCGKKGHFKKMCKSGSKSNWSYRRNRSSRRIKEETSEGSSASDDEDDYPTRLGKLRVRKTKARFSQVEDVSRRREKVVDNASIQTDSSDDEEGHKNEIKKIRVSKTSRNPEAGIELPVTVNGVGFYVDPDTGADLNLFDESHYRMMKEKNPQTKLQKVKQKVIAAINTSVPVKGNSMQPCLTKPGKLGQKRLHKWVTCWSTTAFRNYAARFRMHQIRP